MINKDVFIQDTISIANAVELVKATIAKVGFVYIAPLTEAVQDEKISAAIVATLKGKAQ